MMIVLVGGLQALKGLPKLHSSLRDVPNRLSVARATLESTPQVTLIVFNSVLI